MTPRTTQPHARPQPLLLGLAIIAMANLAVAQESEATVDESPDTAFEQGAPEPAPAPAPEPAPVPATDPASALGLETASETAAEPAAAEEYDAVGISLGVGIASIYNFRGWNSFQQSTQQDQNALFAPSIEWAIGETGLYVGYWGAYQITGDNKREMVDVGLGHEQDLYVGYDLGLADDLLTLSFAFTYFFYPFADEDVAGTANPSIIEPLVGLSVATVLDIGFTASYFHAVQDEIKGLRHAYFNLSLGKGFEFNDTFGMNIGAALGIKAWIEENDTNRFDLAFDWSIPIALTDRLSLEPGIHLAWTDIDTIATGVADDSNTDADESVRKATAGDEFMVYWTLDIGASF